MTTLTTARLALHPLALADVETMHRLWTSASIRKYLWDDDIITLETAQAAIEASIQSFLQDRFGVWGVVLMEADALIGFCGVRLYEGEKELLYGLDEAHWGTGLTTEAAQVVMDYLFTQRITTRLIALANPANVGSCRVAEKLGMRCEREIMLGGELLRYYAIETVED